MPRYVFGFALLKVDCDRLRVVELDSLSAYPCAKPLYLGVEGPADLSCLPLSLIMVRTRA